MSIDYNGLKLAIRKRKIAGKAQNIVCSKKEHTINTFLNSTWSKKKTKEKFLNILNR